MSPVCNQFEPFRTHTAKRWSVSLLYQCDVVWSWLGRWWAGHLEDGFIPGILREFSEFRKFREFCVILGSFCSTASAVWNDLPSELKSRDISRQCFKPGLKTYLYDCAYVLWAPLITVFNGRSVNLRIDILRKL